MEVHLLVDKSTKLPKLFLSRCRDFKDEIPQIDSKILELLILFELKSRTSRLVNIENFLKPVTKIELANSLVQTSKNNN